MVISTDKPEGIEVLEIPEYNENFIYSIQDSKVILVGSKDEIAQSLKKKKTFLEAGINQI